MNIPVLVITLLGALVLIVFLVVRNKKDRKDLENKLNNDYTKPKDDESDVETEDITK
jgi:hypothetical protein